MREGSNSSRLRVRWLVFLANNLYFRRPADRAFFRDVLGSSVGCVQVMHKIAPRTTPRRHASSETSSRDNNFDSLARDIAP